MIGTNKGVDQGAAILLEVMASKKLYVF